MPTNKIKAYKESKEATKQFKGKVVTGSVKRIARKDANLKDFKTYKKIGSVKKVRPVPKVQAPKAHPKIAYKEYKEATKQFKGKVVTGSVKRTTIKNPKLENMYKSYKVPKSYSSFGKTAAKSAAKFVGKRILGPAGIAADAYAVGRGIQEGLGAIVARRHARKTKAHSKTKYGTIDAATRTRKRLQERNQ